MRYTYSPPKQYSLSGSIFIHRSYMNVQGVYRTTAARYTYNKAVHHSVLAWNIQSSVTTKYVDNVTMKGERTVTTELVPIIS